MPGAGLRRRTTAGEWRLGHARFAGAVAGPADDCSELWFTRPGQRPLRLRFRDSLRGDAAAAMAGLRATGLKNVLLSGDRKGVAEGKSVPVRVEIGGRRTIKKTNKMSEASDQV